jgi:hypothetical protein
MRFSTITHRSVWAVAGVALLAVACDRSEQVISPRATSQRSTIAIEVSSASVRAGQQVAVAIANRSLTDLGGVQGSLTFDAARLRYRGQVRDAGDDQILLVNAINADRGELRLAALDAKGLTRTGSLVFDVIGSDYAASLSFKVDEAALNGARVTRVAADVAPGTIVDANLTASAEAKRLTVQDWAEYLSRRQRKGASFSRDPGEIVNGLKFGDTNFDGTLLLDDALYVINVSIGLNEMIVGSDGTGPLGDRDAVVAGNVFPFNDPGVGGVGDATPPGQETDGSRNLSLGDGLAIINESIGVDQPVVGEIIPGRPTTPVSNRVVVSGNITTNTTWTNSNIYELQGGITVTNGATLTIQPGTRVEGQRGTGPGVGGAALFVSRNGRIIADGTPLQPIVMTCVGGPTPRFKGCWGGVTVLGNAGLNDGTLTSPAIAGRAVAGCAEKAAEGSAGLYGGCNDDDDSGIIRYVRIEYAGFRFTPENELNGLALNGVGRGTIIDYVQIHAGLDDGIEMFGGTVNMKHLVLTANSDDSFDYTEGWRGKAQFIIIQHDSLDSDKGFENDNWASNPDALPRATPTIYNVTMVGKANPASTSGTANNNSVGAFNIRVGARPHYFNFIVQHFSFALDIDDASTCVDYNTAMGLELKNSIFAANLRLDASDTGDPAGCGATEADVINQAGSGNTVVATSPLISPLNVMVPDWRPASGTAGGGATPPSDGFFDATATFKGAVPPANVEKSIIPWYAGWTRGWQNPTTP